MSVNLCEEGVVVECLLVNARTRRVNLRSLSEVSSSSSPNGTSGSGLSGWLGFLVLGLGLGLLFKELELGIERDTAGRSGKSPKRRWGSPPFGVMIVGIRLQTMGAVILGDLTLQPSAVLSKSRASFCVLSAEAAS
jgi:hypothetical protein